MITLSMRAIANILGSALLLMLLDISEARAQTVPPGLGFTRDFEVQSPAGDVKALAVHDDGTGSQLYVGGEFNSIWHHSPFTTKGIVRWDGSSWSNVGVGGVSWTSQDGFDPGVHSIASFGSGPGSLLFIGGDFSSYYSLAAGAWLPCGGFVRWDGVDYSQEVTGEWSIGGVDVMLNFDDGTGPALYAGGNSVLGTMMRFDGNGWSAVGGAFVGTPPMYRPEFGQMAVHDDGTGSKLYVTGGFVSLVAPDGQLIPAQGIACWDGVQWTPVSVPPPYSPGPVFWKSLAVWDDLGSGGGLFASIPSTVWRYRAGTWDQVLPTVLGHQVHRLDVFDDGNGVALHVQGSGLYLPGMASGQYVRHARFDGQAWTPIGPIITSVGTYCQNAGVQFDFGQGPDLIRADCYGAGPGFLLTGLTRYRAAYRDVAAVCGGDGSVQRCPCDTRGDVGRGCPNSTSPGGARLAGQGTPALDTLRMTATSMPPSALCVLFQGSTYLYTGTFAGDGVRCVAGTILRLNMQAAQGGEAAFPSDGSTTLRALVQARGDPLHAGSVRYYQAWYRDANPAFCSSGGLLNVTNGMRVVW